MAEGYLTGLQVSGYAPAAGGWVYFYQPGTTVQQTVYQDDAGSVVWTQPITLDQNGRPVNPVYAAQPVRAIFFSSSGAQLLDVARINGQRAEALAISNASWPGESTVDAVLTALGTTLGGTDGNIKTTGTGSVQRSLRAKLSETVSVKDFGAVGNGIADDTAAIVATVTAVNAAGGGTVFLPSGTYLVSSAIALSTGVSMRGVSSTASIIKNTNGSGNCLTAAAQTGLVLEDFGVSHSSTSTGVGIGISGCTRATLSRLRVTGHFNGITLVDNGFGTTPNKASKILFCDIDTTGVAGATNCLLCNCGATTSGGYLIMGNTFTPSTNTAVFAGTESSIAFVGNSSTSTLAALWIQTTHTGSRFFAMANDFGASASNGLVISRATTFGFVEICNSWNTISVTSPDGGNIYYTLGGVSGGTRPSGNYCATSALAGSGSVSPNFLLANHYQVTQSTAATTVTINAPTNVPASGELTLTLANASGGAVTWTLNAAFSPSGAIAPVTGNQVNVTFRANAAGTKLYETGRATTPT